MQIWVVTRHQYGISGLISQMSFHGETSGGVMKCWLFSKALNWKVLTFTPANCTPNTLHPFPF